jgi:hypothetical protein
LEEIEKLRNKAEENLKLAREETSAAKSLAVLAKSEIARAKARENLTHKKLELAKIQDELAEKTRKLVENKIKLKNEGLLEFVEEELKREQADAVHNEKVAEIEKGIAETNHKIADKEVEIAKEKENLSKEKMDVAKEREKLGKLTLEYGKALETHQARQKEGIAEKIHEAQDKLKKAQGAYSDHQAKLVREIKDVYDKQQKIWNKENELSDIRKILSEKIGELEKIRHA